MSQDDVERVARAICIDHTIDLRRAQDFARTAITAYLSAMPQRELLREAEDDAVRLHKLATDRFEEIIVLKARLAEALDVLTPFAVGARSIDVDPPGDHEPSHGRGSVTAGDLRRARAVYEKTLAALDAKK